MAGNGIVIQTERLTKSFGTVQAVDGHLFSPAEVTLSHLESKRVYKAGALNPEVLKKSLGIK